MFTSDALAGACAAGQNHRGVTVVTGVDEIPDFSSWDGDHFVSGRSPDGSGLPSFAPVSQLIAAVTGRLGANGSDLVERYSAGLRYLDPALLGEPQPRVSPLDAHAVAYAIVRRISRESLHAAIHIDMVVLFMLHAFRRLFPGRPVMVFVPDADLLDRPSLRVINRLQWLRDRRDGIRFVMLCRGDPFGVGDQPANPIRNRLWRSRTRLFSRLREEWSPAIVQAGAARPLLPAGIADIGWSGDPITAIAENLVDHNYDRAYLLAECVTAGGPPPAVHADVLRLVGLCDGNVGEIDLAIEALGMALDLAPGRALRAHLHYLRGLLFTKRRYDLDTATREYASGVAELDAAAPNGGATDGAEEAFERAWLMNGQALIAALRARELELRDRPAALHAVLRTEIEAFRLASTGAEPRHVYLRHNLLANTAFVLEMLGEFDEAIRFWNRAFGQFLTRPQATYRFESVYRYRVGLLQWRAGRSGEAIQSLRAALRLAGDSADRFQTERIDYGLAYVLLDSGVADQAAAHFADGMRMAWQLRDPLACLQHASGLVVAARRAGRPHLAAAVPRWLRLTGHQALCTAVADAELPAPPRPSPKLPAYVPGVDLEPSPEINLNVYLASAATDRPAPLPSPLPSTTDRTAAMTIGAVTGR